MDVTNHEIIMKTMTLSIAVAAFAATATADINVFFMISSPYAYTITKSRRRIYRIFTPLRKAGDKW